VRQKIFRKIKIANAGGRKKHWRIFFEDRRCSSKRNLFDALSVKGSEILGLRGLNSNPLFRWRRLAERQRKHRCRYCHRLFSGKRADKPALACWDN
jgi:hypothetical protein